jgi:hypothetical protein
LVVHYYKVLMMQTALSTRLNSSGAGQGEKRKGKGQKARESKGFTRFYAIVDNFFRNDLLNP